MAGKQHLFAVDLISVINDTTSNAANRFLWKLIKTGSLDDSKITSVSGVGRLKGTKRVIKLSDALNLVQKHLQGENAKQFEDAIGRCVNGDQSMIQVYRESSTETKRSDLNYLSDGLATYNQKLKEKNDLKTQEIHNQDEENNRSKISNSLLERNIQLQREEVDVVKDRHVEELNFIRAKNAEVIAYQQAEELKYIRSKNAENIAHETAKQALRERENAEYLKHQRALIDLDEYRESKRARMEASGTGVRLYTMKEFMNREKMGEGVPPLDLKKILQSIGTKMSLKSESIKVFEDAVWVNQFKESCYNEFKTLILSEKRKLGLTGQQPSVASMFQPAPVPEADGA